MENIRIQALHRLASLDAEAEAYGEYRMTQFWEKDVALLRKAVTLQSVEDVGNTETALILFLGWLAGSKVVETGWSDEEQEFTVDGRAVSEVVREFLKGE